MEAVFLFGLFILLLMLSVPIGYAIGMVTLVTMLHFTSMPTLMIAQNSIAGVDSFPLLAIPFFMLAGNLMSGGGIAKRLVNFFECFIGHITGGLGMVTIIVCMFFAAISGSAVATVSAVGAFMIPQMVEHGYSKFFRCTDCSGRNHRGYYSSFCSFCHLWCGFRRIHYQSFYSRLPSRHINGRRPYDCVLYCFEKTRLSRQHGTTQCQCHLGHV